LETVTLDDIVSGDLPDLVKSLIESPQAWI